MPTAEYAHFFLFRNVYADLAPAASGVEIARTENKYIAEIGVAGSAADQIEVTYKDDAVTVSGKSNRRTFTQSFMLSDDSDPDTIKARVEHGLLTLTLNRHPQIGILTRNPKRSRFSSKSLNVSTTTQAAARMNASGGPACAAHPRRYGFVCREAIPGA